VGGGVSAVAASVRAVGVSSRLRLADATYIVRIIQRFQALTGSMCVVYCAYLWLTEAVPESPHSVGSGAMGESGFGGVT
jgi:hypothetical protein